MRNSATQPSGDQDGEVMRATDVRAASAPTPPAAPLLRQVPPLKTRLHVTIDPSWLRPRQPGEYHAGNLSKELNALRLVACDRWYHLLRCDFCLCVFIVTF